MNKNEKANKLYERARRLRADILAYNQRAYELNNREPLCLPGCAWREQPHEHLGWNLPLVRVNVMVESEIET